MKQLLLQAFNLIRQNPFYATISIIGTAVTIAFVMVVVMIYDLAARSSTHRPWRGCRGCRRYTARRPTRRGRPDPYNRL